MTRIHVPTAEEIIWANQHVCMKGGNPHQCFDSRKIESAIHTAFYPGAYPFAAGGIVHVAAALCFYLVKDHAFMDGNKRTAALSAIAFLNKNGWNLRYPIDAKKGLNALAEIIEACAAGTVGKEELMEWFDRHKVKL